MSTQAGQQTSACCWTRLLLLVRFKETMQPLMAECCRSGRYQCGALAQVRSAGEDAWLGRPAPEDPTLDEPQAHTPLLQLKCNEQCTDLDKHRTDPPQSTPLATTGMRRASFRSVKEAVDAAQDGDQIILLPGIHNGMGEAINITKRILLRGSGQLGDSKIDQRANSPTFRISRGAVIMNIEVDMTGFREAVLITGTDRVSPVLQKCSISCSGDDAVHVNGKARPTLQQCNISGKKCGRLFLGAAKSSWTGATSQVVGNRHAKQWTVPVWK
ncbi:hypothetical protein ABBQ32_010088 [Trebouxia sp. C0010 RCD-2024]